MADEPSDLPLWRRWHERNDSLKHQQMPSPEIRRRGKKQLGDYLESIDSPPPLYRINGFGGGLYGWLNDPSFGQAHLKLYFISALWLPIVPVSAYFVRREEDGYAFYGKLSLWHATRLFKWRMMGFYFTAWLHGIGVAVLFMAVLIGVVALVAGLRSLLP